MVKAIGGQGVHREVKSEGHEEKHWAVIKARARMNRSAKNGNRSSLHYGGEGILIHPLYQGVCGRHDAEEQCVTPGELNGFLSGIRISDPISEERKGKQSLVSSRIAE
ncbi:MAG: hypothetical protein C3F07_15185 [Anaerolineales bacterium]|nr:MAG: hypothetical protein C3F07_15185 [Anaerolineales bacterium]